MTDAQQMRCRQAARWILSLHLIFVAGTVGHAAREYGGLGIAATCACGAAGAVVALIPYVRAVVLFMALLVGFHWWSALLISIAAEAVHRLGVGFARSARIIG